MRISLRRGETEPPQRIEEWLYPAVATDPNVDTDALNELLRDPSPLISDAPASEPSASDGQEPAVEQTPEHIAVRIARWAALVTAVAVLCGAGVAVASLAMQRQANSTEPGPDPLGAAAQSEQDSPEPSPPSAKSDATPAQQRSACKQAAAYYRDLAERPDEARQLLSAALPPGQRKKLGALPAVDQVDVYDLRVRPDGLVRATVLFSAGSAGTFRVVHSLRPDAAAGPEVHLLAAQRLAPGHAKRQVRTASMCAE